jgi:hypothetical protein
MLGRWIDQRVEDRLNELWDVLVLEAKTELRKTVPIATVADEYRLAKDRSYTVLDTETNKPETIDGWFDTSTMKSGDRMEIEIAVKLQGGRTLVWDRVKLEDDQDHPALRLSNLLAPAGAKITISHQAGREFDIAWFLRRLA